MLLTHEFNHFFSGKLGLYFSGPYWLTEGLALYVAKQIPGKTFRKPHPKSEKESKRYLFYRLNMKKLSDRMYVPQYYAAKTLIEDFGEKKIFKLIETYKNRIRRKTFEKKFYKIYGITYNEFIRSAAKLSVRK